MTKLIRALQLSKGLLAASLHSIHHDGFGSGSAADSTESTMTRSRTTCDTCALGGNSKGALT